MLASRYACEKIVQELLDAGADRSVINKRDKRAVDIAKEWRREKIIPLLQMQKIT